MEISFDICKQYIDVRSESEFYKGHITGALNIPILYDSERAEVGYIYKQISTDEARLKGIEFASGKLNAFFGRVQELARKYGEQNLVFYCARGGYRSRSVHLFFKGLGLQTLRLSNGYKGYRASVLEELSKPVEYYPKFIGINGLTGSGKTKILNELERLGEPVLDLERAARHKGSNLGKIGFQEPQCAQQFENDIFTELLRAKNRGYCFVEMESRKIGSLLVPSAIYQAYHEHTFASVWIEKSVEERAAFLLKDYAEMDNFDQEFKPGLEKIKRYISGDLYQNIVNHYGKGNLQAVTEILLKDYYDPLYIKSTQGFVRDIVINTADHNAAAKEIIEFKNKVMTQA